MTDDKKYKVIRITITEDYIIPMIDDERTEINGWTIKEIIEDWFITHPMDTYHATRDGHRIGNSRKIVNTEVKELP